MAALLKENKTQADIAARRTTLLEEGIAKGDIADWGQRTKLRVLDPEGNRLTFAQAM
jgi:hypothetical protein